MGDRKEDAEKRIFVFLIKVGWLFVQNGGLALCENMYRMASQVQAEESKSQDVG